MNAVKFPSITDRLNLGYHQFKSKTYWKLREAGLTNIESEDWLAQNDKFLSKVYQASK
jgi:hypothetical protein